MGFFGNKLKDGMQNRAARAFEEWVMPKSDYVNNINSIDALYTITVFIGAVGAAALLGGRQGGILISFFAAFLAISKPVKSVFVPKLYDAIAPVAKWLPYQEALRADAILRAEREAAEERANQGIPVVAVPVAQVAQAFVPAAAPVAPAQDSAPTSGNADVPEDLVAKALRLWLDYDEAGRLEKAEKVAAFVAAKDEAFDVSSLEATPKEAKPFVARALLMGLAGKRGFAGA
jgi:hypothetical protein